jgi:hypothetical protein
MSSQPVEDLGKIIARPPFGDFVIDDMINMNSFGANLEFCRRDIMIRSKVRCGQAPTRHDLVVLGEHIFDRHVPIGKCEQQFRNELLHCSETFDGLKSRCKIYEIVCKYVIELVQPARVGGVMIAMKQFERLLIVHVPSLHFRQILALRHQSPDRDPSPCAAIQMTQGNRRGRQAARHDHIIAGSDGHVLREQKPIGSLECRTDWSTRKRLPARHRCNAADPNAFPFVRVGDGAYRTARDQLGVSYDAHLAIDYVTNL